MNRIIQNTVFLKTLYHVEPSQRKHMLEQADSDEIKLLCDIAGNILQGRIITHFIHGEKLKEFKLIIRSLTSRRINLSRKRQSLCEFHIVVPLLIQPFLYLLGGP